MIALAAFHAVSFAGGRSVTVTPVDWDPITGSGGGGNAPQIFTGFTEPIIARFAVSVVEGAGTFTYVGTAGSASFVDDDTLSDILAGEDLAFTVSHSSGDAFSGTVSVTNDSDNGALIGLFDFSIDNPAP